MRIEWVVSAVVVLAAGITVKAQVQYATGQNVAPIFEGWERNPDGSYNMVFGYLNRNYEEAVDIPIGAQNSITIGDEVYGDKGQPTHFYPRRQRFLFRVVVPKDWDEKRKVVWTLTSHGKTDQAKGWLQPEWELSDDVIVENMGGGVPDQEPVPHTDTFAEIGDVKTLVYYPATAPLDIPATRRLTRPLAIAKGLTFFLRPLWRRVTWQRRTFHNLPA